MSFRNIFFDTKKSKIYLWQTINSKRLEYDEIDWAPYLFVKDEESDIQTIDGFKVKRKTFGSYFEYYNYSKNNTNIYENNVRPEIQYLAERYHRIPDEDLETPKLRVYSLDIEINETDPNVKSSGFPHAHLAEQSIVLISVYDDLENKTHTFGLNPYNGKYKGEDFLQYVHCKDERALLLSFLHFIHNNPPDVISGWNCLPLTNHIFKNNEIDILSNIKENEILTFNNNVECVYPHSFKKLNKIKLANGFIIEASSDHIIPIRQIDNDKYTNLEINKKNDKILIDKDLKVSDIPINEKSCFIKIPLNMNKNIDYNIDDNLLYIAGIIYTDGSLRDKNNINSGFRVYQSNKEFLENLPLNLTTTIGGNREKGFSRSIKTSLVKPIYHFIYDDNGNKRLNLNKLSKLSKRQFYIFLSGILDGDGSGCNGLSSCDYTDDGINTLYSLCIWNGLFVTINNNIIRYLEYDKSLLQLKHPIKWNKLKYKMMDRTSSQLSSKIKYKKTNDGYFVKISNIEETNNIVEMGDIKTESGYFISNGILVHNCYQFDIQYIINRIKVLFGETTDLFKKLSPINVVRTWFSKDNSEFNVDIAGVTILDYMDLFKWYSPNKLEKYSLDFVCKYVLEKGKVDYSEYKNLRQLYFENWDLYVEYNIIDAYRVAQLEEQLGYIKLVQSLSLLCKAPMKYYNVMTQLIEGLLLTYFRRNGMCAPYFYGGTQETFEAAYVKEPQIGKHEWVIDCDITSSYPTAIITLNISNETFYGKIQGFTEDEVMYHTRNNNFTEFDMIKDNGLVHFEGKRLETFNKAIEKKLLCVAPCGSVFSTKDKGKIAEVTENVFNKRIEVKDKMNKMKRTLSDLRGENLDLAKIKIAKYHSLQLSLKIIINAIYGITSVPYSRYFNLHIAEAIVSCGRQTIKAGERFTNRLLNNPTVELKDIIEKMREEISKL